MSVCRICNLDLMAKPRNKTWEGLFTRHPKLKEYFDQSEDKIDIPTSVDCLFTSCKATFHNICVTEWLMLTKSLTCPACDVVMSFADMRKKHFKIVQENQGAIFGLARLGLDEAAAAATTSNSSNNVISTVDAAKGDFRGGKIQPQVIQTEVLHNHRLTKCTTFLYSGKSKLLKELESSEPDTNDESDWGVAPPWSANRIDSAVKDEPVVFNLTPYHSRSASSIRESDSATYSASESESQESIRCNSLDGNLAARDAALRRRRYAFSSGSGHQGPHRFGLIFPPSGQIGYYRL